jgi:hypothetical protein
LPLGCPNNEDLICGSNGITYKNECVFNKVKCEQKLDISITSRVECPKNTKSDSDDEKEVDGNDRR